MKALLLVSSLALCAGFASAEDIAMKEHAGLRFACGGAGVEERTALAALRPQANLEFLFVTAKRGGYLADVDLIVMGAYGHSRLRELALGGATRTLLEAMTVPVLMAH